MKIFVPICVGKHPKGGALQLCTGNAHIDKQRADQELSKLEKWAERMIDGFTTVAEIELEK